MTRNELIGELLWEGWPLRQAEHEADVILGSRDDECLLPDDKSVVSRMFEQYKES